GQSYALCSACFSLSSGWSVKKSFFLENLFNTSMVEKVKNFWVFNLFKSRFFETERKNAKSFSHFQHAKV
ncbi:MAG: hypothetical protein IKC43_03515, partial [Clostridia bacterium]|nr:hypothetical protein [Clostridia bacterium]